MIDFSGLFDTQGMLFLIMFLGMYLTKTGMIDTGGKRLMMDLVIKVTLPASIVRSFQMEFTREILISCMEVCVAAVVIQIGSWLLGMILYPGIAQECKKVLQYATICSNAGILGNPVAEGIFGITGLLYASIYVIPQRVFMWSLGLSYFTEAPDARTLVKKVMTHPCIIAVLVGFVIMGFQIEITGCLGKTLNSIANCNTFLAMGMVGTILAEVPLRMLADRLTLYYCFVRLILIPFLVYAGCRITGMEGLAASVCITLSAMPAASITTVMASKYGKDEIFATKCVVLSTILSMVTVPVWCIFLTIL